MHQKRLPTTDRVRRQREAMAGLMGMRAAPPRWSTRTITDFDDLWYGKKEATGFDEVDA